MVVRPSDDLHTVHTRSFEIVESEGLGLGFPFPFSSLEFGVRWRLGPSLNARSLPWLHCVLWAKLLLKSLAVIFFILLWLVVEERELKTTTTFEV